MDPRFDELQRPFGPPQAERVGGACPFFVTLKKSAALSEESKQHKTKYVTSSGRQTYVQ